MISALKITRPALSGGYYSGTTTYATSTDRKYDVWGAVRGNNKTGYSYNRYCANLGHVADDDTGLIYMRARYYEPGTGRFISEDPAMDGSNWYTYCDNEPVSGVDYSGKSRTDAIAGIAYAGMAVLSAYLTISTATNGTASGIGSMLGGGITLGFSAMATYYYLLALSGSSAEGKLKLGVAGVVTALLMSGFDRLLIATSKAIDEMGKLAKVAGGVALKAGSLMAGYALALLAALMLISEEEWNGA
ncbi:MAG: RHS repeat-associated core domain-containing protein [Armatimonadetes bacterium]|nr:RHS repeat-associated core domain-containing protein [Armatimonadota bacterium]